MSTLRQQDLAKAVVENLNADEPLNKQELLEKVGYAESVALKKPGEILESKGVQYELKKLGFHADNAKRVIGEILNNEHVEERDRLKAAELVLKVTGDFAPEKHLTLVKKIISIDE